ncbi:LacI family DNA-binding transcriptional regulator [Propionicicella superfundia]|uniref:LacI family DNA-binding transcriptional regulator n=1 Tax=Propionicicella superfundia TaxID=348582 RepID=UPI000428F73A|nr:LacI family DNA-binding transcriptional regulator [Propionicicella superfundia]
MHQATIRDVAGRAGVSIATASRVLNDAGNTSEASRARVRDAARMLGYRANGRARSLRSSRADTIGVLISDIRNPFFADIAHGVEQAALAAGMVTVVCNANESTQQQALCLDLLLTQRVGGIVMAPQGDGTGALTTVLDHGLPLVFVDRVVESARPVPSVTSDNVAGIVQAVEHLTGLGHRRVGYVAGPQQTSTGRERLSAFQRAAAERGLDLDPGLIHLGDFRMASGESGAHVLLDLPEPPTAIIAADSLMTLGVAMACRKRGVVIGRELSLIGYDDEPVFSLIDPPLTVIAHDPARMGELAFRMIADVIAGESVASIVLPTGLIVRGSTGAVPTGGH